jgi:hypothetical protein
MISQMKSDDSEEMCKIMPSMSIQSPKAHAAINKPSSENELLD